MSRAVRVAAACILVAGGLASAVLAAGPVRRAATTTTAPSTTLVSTAPEVLAFSGHGFGHGMGMSQWGAKGYAERGWTFDRILGHYYPGTTLGPAPVSVVRVELAQAKRVTLDGLGPWRVTDAAGTRIELDQGRPLRLGPGLTVKGEALAGPLTFSSRLPLLVADKPFRGRLAVTSNGRRLEVVDVVGLEAYLKGVVPAEMPSNWPPEALEAQAVAARSYVLANLTVGRAFDVFGDTRDQAYGGISAESPVATAAVEATRAQVVLYGGKVADTLFFSSSGGRTASAAETIGKPVPYLVSVPDPWDVESPYHDWGPVLVDALEAAKRLHVAAPLTDVRATSGRSGRVQSLTAVASDGSEVTLPGAAVRRALGLRSTWFTPSLLELDPQTKTMTYGGAVSLTGFTRGVETLALEAKGASASRWAAAGNVTVRADGTFAAVVKPRAATSYRLAWGAVRAGLARIAVAPLVDASVSADSASGTIRPPVVGAPVELQRQDGALWSTVAATSADAGGAWSFPGPLTSGTYRVRATPGHGLASGVSATSVVP